jgi:hypothetical protein
VSGGEQAGEHVKRGGDMRPELEQAVEPMHRGRVSRWVSSFKFQVFRLGVEH